ncbi:MAG: MoxR family ATPase [Caloramator sp.]|nr:MoxR family ATPase [Caloramator sp.]
MEKYQIIQNIIENIERVIYGKRGAIEKIIITLISGGHVLIEDVPGLGKTTLVHALAKSINCDFKRIQFTPDLLPSDITGISVYNPNTMNFEFKFGPIMSQIILADEINRTSPKTQSSLLEVMEERQITADGNTYKVKEPFMVLATQNPIEYEGTFPLPEAQLDRFMMKISLGYPDEEYELFMLKRFKEGNPLIDLKPVAEAEDINALRGYTKKIYVDEKIERYIISIIKATREREEILLGASPRASINLLRCSQGRALLFNRDYVIPDDVKSIAYSVLSHRIILKPEYRLKGMKSEEVLENIISSVSVPGVAKYV